MAALDVEHRMMLDGIRYSLREITDELTDWADVAYADHGRDAVNPDPIALAVHLKVLTDLARDAAHARDHLAKLMARDVRAHPATFAEPIEGIGQLKVSASSVKHDYDHDALRAKVAAMAGVDSDGVVLDTTTAVERALRCVGGEWRVRDLRALGIDARKYRDSTYTDSRARIEASPT